MDRRLHGDGAMTWWSDFLTLAFGLAALVFAVTVLMPGAKFSRWLRERRWPAAEVVAGAMVVSMLALWLVIFMKE